MMPEDQRETDIDLDYEDGDPLDEAEDGLYSDDDDA